MGRRRFRPLIELPRLLPAAERVASGKESDGDLRLLDAAEARQIDRQAGKAVSGCRSVAAKLGVRKKEIDRMSSTFEHEDLKAALRTSKTNFV